MPGKKNLGKLIPTKKNVIDKRTGKTNEITYYVDPNKDAKHPRRRGAHADPEIGPSKPDVDSAHTNKLKTDDPSLKLKNKDGQPDEAIPDNKNSINDNPFGDVKDFEDFGKKGIDPRAARQFFCNM